MIDVSGLCCTVGEFSLEDVSFSVDAKEYFVLLGRPGSGKTLLLECLAGLRRLDAGRIEIANADVTDAEPRRRGVGYVPQDLALFPTMTVAANIAFGLRAQGAGSDEAAIDMEHTAKLLDIRHLLGRTIEGLSGGERQRVALARALAVRPRVLLLDEPLCTLDEDTREGVMAELRHVQRKTGTATIHVCHSIEEMMAMADRAAILRDGRIVQVGTPAELCKAPADPEVAGFLRLGSILHGTAQHVGETTIIHSDGLVFQANGRADGEISFLIRSEEIRLSFMPAGPKETNAFAGRIVGAFRAGPMVIADIQVPPATIRAVLSRPRAGPTKLDVGTEIHLSFPPSAVFMFPAGEGGKES